MLLSSGLLYSILSGSNFGLRRLLVFPDSLPFLLFFLSTTCRFWYHRLTAHVINAVLLTSVLYTTNSCFYASSRMLLAREGHAPAIFDSRGVPIQRDKEQRWYGIFLKKMRYVQFGRCELYWKSPLAANWSWRNYTEQYVRDRNLLSYSYVFGLIHIYSYSVPSSNPQAKGAVVPWCRKERLRGRILDSWSSVLSLNFYLTLS